MFQYFLKVVSTKFELLDGTKVKTHQYSATHFERDLSTGAMGETKEGVHISHSNTGMPGESICRTSLAQVLNWANARYVH